MNNKSFEYISHHGSTFNCETCDFSDPIIVDAEHVHTIEDLMADVAEMIGWHAINIRPHLNGFAGYDCIEFERKE